MNVSKINRVIIVGAGLAGSEAAWQAARLGARVTLYEMRPMESTPAHKTGDFAELVCSNSLRAAGMENAVGVLKEEMRRLSSIVMEAADATHVPAGGALAVDREGFSRYITERVESHPLVTVLRERVTSVPLADDAVTIVASGPLTDGALAEDVARLTGGKGLYFYDAAAPIVTLDSVDMTRAYRASRYGKGEAAYINCPLTKEEYEAFWDALVHAEQAPTHDFEKEIFFEGCMPVEVMAERGKDTLLFGPMKPVGLEHPETGERPYAVVQPYLAQRCAPEEESALDGAYRLRNGDGLEGRAAFESSGSYLRHRCGYADRLERNAVFERSGGNLLDIILGAVALYLLRDDDVARIQPLHGYHLGCQLLGVELIVDVAYHHLLCLLQQRGSLCGLQGGRYQHDEHPKV